MKQQLTAFEVVKILTVLSETLAIFKKYGNILEKEQLHPVKIK